MYLSADDVYYKAVEDFLNEEVQDGMAPLLDGAGLLTIESVENYMSREWQTPADEAREWAERYVSEPYNQPFIKQK